MKFPATLELFFAENDWGVVTNTRPVSGGCINNAVRCESERGPTALLKTNSNAPADMFAREAEGLRALGNADGLRVPTVFGFSDSWILLEFLESGPQKKDYAEQLGAQLARLHQSTNDHFGFEHDNYIGSTPQPNAWTSDGHTFFAEQRLQFQGKLAREKNLLSAEDMKQLEQVIKRLPELVPKQSASLIHGDLWSGNIMTGPNGEPVIIDPAAHYGWAEAELAMTALFGRLSERAYQAYEAASPIAANYSERFDIYNLYHLLNHLNLFGRGYHAQVLGIITRYA